MLNVKLFMRDELRFAYFSLGNSARPTLDSVHDPVSRSFIITVAVLMGGEV